MNKASFLSLVRQASRISDQEVEELEKLIVNFPYCQTAYLLIAKAAYDKGSMLSNQKLKKAAIYAANRQLLKKLIYTSDATVALQPVAPEKTVEPETALTPPTETPTAASQGQEPIAFVETAVESETLSEPVEKVVVPESVEETIAEQQEKAPETPIAETTSETEEETVQSETVPEVESTQEEVTEEETISITEIIAQTDYEDATIAEEILEEGYLPHSEAAFLNAPEKTETPESETEIFSETETELEPVQMVVSKAEVAETERELQVLEVTNVEEVEAKTEKELADGAEIEAFRTEVFGVENIVGPAGQALTEEELQNQIFLAEELEIAGAFDNPAAHEVIEFNPDIISPVTEAEAIQENPEAISQSEKQPEPVVNDDLLHETLASFDQYLFKPEKEQPELQPVEDVKVVNPENEIQAIYYNDSIGYWMNSSRMGESLEFKNELTHQQPYDFHPELLWEYNKTHELQKEIKPAPSKLSHQLDIIDQFLKMTPRLKTMANAKIKTEAQEDLSLKSSKINKNLASENFANILVQQGKIKKAIKIYEHLILKIPEKKAYFVAQIEKLQNPE